MKCFIVITEQRRFNETARYFVPTSLFKSLATFMQQLHNVWYNANKYLTIMYI